MSLISMHGAWLSFSDAPLLDNTELHIEENERVCLVGRNGAGKSTLMKILNREVPLDDGRMIYEQDLIVARLQQDPPRNVAGTVYDFVAEGVEEQAVHLKAYHDISHKVMTDPSDKNLNEMARIQEILDNQNLWQLESRINEVLLQLGLDADTELSALSGGWLRKAALGRALVSSPRVLLLDEPTNHLDIEAIDWLEGFLKEFQGSIVFISHDRSFIRNMATRIVDLDRGKLVSYPGDYDQYLLAKEEALRVEDLQNAEFDRKLAQEEVWIRQGIKARRTRNEGRVRALKALRETRSERREVVGKANFTLAAGGDSGKLVADLVDVSYAWGDKKIVNQFSTRIMRGDRIGLVGANGAGKSTLLKLILGELQPQSGTVKLGTHLEVAYFDQLRDQLDLDKNAVDNIAGGREFIDIDGKSKHIFSYLSDFLFSGERARTPLRALSGGERNRVLLAKLFSKSANLLVLDEPTNDLDVETLELLEDILTEYTGTLLLVSHDRAFLNNIVSSVIAFEGRGNVLEYIGGYDDWLRQGGKWTQADELPAAVASTPVIEPKKSEPAEIVITKTPSKQKKLSYKFQKEFDDLPQKIELLEKQMEDLQLVTTASDFYSQAAAVVEQKLQELAKVQQQLDDCFERWAELEDMQQE